MNVSPTALAAHNERLTAAHQRQFRFLADTLEERGIDVQALLDKITAFQIAIPSWALGTGGTRFGRFPSGGEPRNLEEKIDDVGLIHALSRSANSISLHIPWDIPGDLQAITQQLAGHGLSIDSVNSNTFQDQQNQPYSYKFGSLCHTDPAVRRQAVAHNIACVEYGKQLGAKTLTVWLADGSNFPGQHHFRQAYQRTADSLVEILRGHALRLDDAGGI